MLTALAISPWLRNPSQSGPLSIAAPVSCSLPSTASRMSGRVSLRRISPPRGGRRDQESTGLDAIRHDPVGRPVQP